MGTTSHFGSRFEDACQLATDGQLLEAQQEFQALLTEEPHTSHTPKTSDFSSNHLLLQNNFAAVEAALGDFSEAKQRLQSIADHDQEFLSAMENLAFLDGVSSHSSSDHSTPETNASNCKRIAIVSLLFNWPSTGGGTVHTKELADFLQQEGYEFRHFYAVNHSWRVGQVTEPLPYPHSPIVFNDANWHADFIRETFRNAVREFAPDAVVVTDSWNTKPLLCEAVAEFPYFIRIAALESLCPLNNVRLLVDEQQQPQQCELHQLREPQACRECVQQNQHLSGGLHQAERQLAGFFADDYPQRLREAFSHAAGVLAVNPTISELIEPYTDQVHVVPSGFDEARFPAEAVSYPLDSNKKRLLFAGLTNEFMKGFHVLQQAGELLWQQRQDFEIIATADPVGQVNEYMKFIGWQSQESLPAVIQDCDILVFPTIAQEALGRTAVEAMGCGRPVIASGIGGLSWVVEDGVTGLLCEAGNPHDLAAKCAELLDNHTARVQFGINGRKKFERDFTWNRIIKNHYLQLFGTPVRDAAVV